MGQIGCFRRMREVTLSLLILVQCLLFGLESKFESYSILTFLQFSIDWIFLGDLLIRVKDNGKRYWKAPLNIIDAFIVIASVVGHFIVSDAQTLTALRVIRLLRMFRILSFVPHIENIIQGVARALRASKGVFLMLAILLTFFSILGYLLFRTSIPSHFADPLLSGYTVFSLFTVEGWNEVPALVTGGTLDYYLIRAYVISVIVFGSFFALSLANAIFIDEMVMDNNAELEERMDKLIAVVELQNRQISDLKSIIEKSSLNESDKV